MFNLIFDAANKSIKSTADTSAIIAIVLLSVVIFIGLAALSFWLFTWAIMTLFHYNIDFTWINYGAFIVLTSNFGRYYPVSKD